MSNAYRSREGGRIDRRQRLTFTFDGKPYRGYAGDTLASALLANGVHLVGRSFKYHRPRGILAAGPEEPNALVDVSRGEARSTPNLRATQVELYEGLNARSQNRWPTLARDAGAINDTMSPMFAAGFYYKTFMGPRFLGGAKAWTRVFEPVIRRAAGLGKAPSGPDPDRYAVRHAHCDVLVVGAGPAGLAAATAAAATGARVILCDEQHEVGGSLLSERLAFIDRVPALDHVAAQREALARAPNVTILTRTTAFGAFAQNYFGLLQRLTDHLPAPAAGAARERLWQVRAKQVVLATGALERPLVFPDNDRPGIMLAGAGYTYLERYGVRPGQRAVIVGAHDTIYRAALAHHAAGIDIAAILDLRPQPEGPLVTQARQAGLRIDGASTITGTKGRLRVAKVMAGRIDDDGSVANVEQFACDHVLMSAGWTPAVHLFSQARGKLTFDAARQMFLPHTGEGATPGVHAIQCAGACHGVSALDSVIEDGYRAGDTASQRAGRGGRSSSRASAPPPSRSHVEHAPPAGGGMLGAAPHNRNAARVKAFVDFQNDVTAKDIKLATQEGFRSIEHVKRYTTTGMATDQGKTSNMHALAIAAAALGKPLPEVGLTTFRQPYTPISFGAMAGYARGNLFDPVRMTPIHPWAAKRGAVFEDVGNWKRARYFPQGAEDMHAAVARECRITRARVGMFDASTLGKIEVVGPDATRFMDLIYTNAWAKLGLERCRYGVMLNEAGFIMDDGVVARLAEDRFHVTTTTGGAPRVLAHMEDYLQTEFPDWKVWLTSTTEQWAVIALNGPHARAVLQAVAPGLDLSPQRLPHMGATSGAVAGIEARIFRVSFTGELGFEVNVPADYGQHVWEALWAACEAEDGVAYGTEAMHVMRAEKGYIIVGQETDGTVTPDDVGLGWAIGKAKADFVGKRSLTRPDIVKPDRKQLVGLMPADEAITLEEGAQVTESASPEVGSAALGHVTSSYWSEAMGRPIALGLVSAGRAREGTTVHVPMPDGSIAVTVTAPQFYDREGDRLHG
ncbi:MAG: sarcosine oxidase subunit alpha family protein [Pseudomonadota bacterium]